MRDFFRPVATLLTGTVVAQIIVYAARPLLTRLFTPDDFGVLGFFAGFVAVVASFASGKYEDALMLPQKDKNAWALAGASVLLSCATAVIVLLLLPFRDLLAPLVSTDAALEMLLLAPLSVLFVGVSRTGDAWLTRVEQFGSVAKSRVIHSGASVPLQIAAGAARVGPIGLVGGLVSGQALQSVFYAVRSTSIALKKGLTVPGVRKLVAVARRYRRFALYGAPATALNTASVQLPALTLLFFFDASVLGNYAIGYSVLAVPLTLLGSSVAQVYYVRAAEALRGGDIAGLTLEVFRRLVALGLFPILCVAAAGPPIFEVVFGSSWSDAGLFASFLSPWILLVFLSSPLSRLFDLLEKQRALLIFNLTLLIVRAAALVAGGMTGDASTAILLFGLAGAGMWLIHTVWMLRLAHVRLRSVLTAIYPYLWAIPLAIGSVLAGKMLGDNLLITVLCGVTGIVYYWLLLHREPDLIFSSDKHPSNESAL